MPRKSAYKQQAAGQAAKKRLKKSQKHKASPDVLDVHISAVYNAIITGANGSKAALQIPHKIDHVDMDDLASSYAVSAVIAD